MCIMMRVIVCPSLLVALWLPVASAQEAPGGDTLRVGMARLRFPPPGVDTIDATFEGRAPDGTARRQSSVNIVTRTLEQLDGHTVVHASTEQGPQDRRSRYDLYVAPTTGAPIRFTQRTPIDSAVLAIRNGCVSGWIHLASESRRALDCEPIGDRFNMTLDLVIAALPFADGYSAVLATYGVLGPGTYAVEVTGSAVVELRGRRMDAWRVEHRSSTDRGQLHSTFLVEKASGRMLRAELVFPQGGRSTRILRNP